MTKAIAMLALGDLSIPAMVRAAAAGFGDKPCVIAPERTVSFREFAVEVAAISRAFLEIGVRPGDRVAIIDTNSLNYLEAICALGTIGAISVPLNYRQREPELRYQLENSGARLLLANPCYEVDAEALGQDLDLGWRPIGSILALGLDSAAEPEAGEIPEFGDLAGNTPFAICYTSGTTGQPKGVALDHKCVHMRALKLLLELRLHPDDVMHFMTPMFHISCLALTLMAVMRGATQVILPQFELETTLGAVKRHDVIFIFAVPTMFGMILDRPGFEVSDFASIRTIMYAGAPIGVPLLKRVMAVYEGDLVQFLGQTEDLPQTVLTPEDHRRALKDHGERLSSIGRACMGVEVTICSKDGEPLGRGERGEIVTRGGTAMTGYWGNDEETAKSLRDGRIFTGDLGWQDEDGYVYLDGRKAHVIIRGGENVYPAEVEKALMAAPGVQDSVILGLPDETWGEIVAAVVVPSGPEHDEQAIIDFCRQRLASYKSPERVYFCDALPFNAAGKVMRHVLLETLGEHDQDRAE
jgi:fatty-acyl-CoA synthase